MTHRHSTARLGVESTQVEHSQQLRAETLSVKRNENEALGTLMRILSESPALAADRSFVIRHAVDEFMELAKESPDLEIADYCEQIASLGTSVQESIYRQLEVERFIDQHASLKAELNGAAWPRPGERRGSFNFVEEVGRGALARVYLCSQPDLGDRHVIVKMGRSSLTEAHTLGRLRHPHIVPIHSIEVDSISGMTMLCMPFLGRSTLHDLIGLRSKPPISSERSPAIKAGRLWEQPSDRIDEYAARPATPPLESYCDCIAQMGVYLADALACAHAQGILHSDVKPSNILLSPLGTPLLLDFNLSGSQALSTAPMGGTLPYMPPEQVRAIAIKNPSSVQYDQRSDLFSLGVVLYEALSGRLPFPLPDNAVGLDELSDQLLELQRRGCAPLKSIVASVPIALANAVDGCLRFHPQDRIQSAETLRDLLSANIGSAALLRRGIWRHRGKVSVAVAMVSAVFLGGAIHKSRRPPEHIRLLHEAVERREAADFIGAETRLKRAISLQPAFNDALFELGRTALAGNELSRARESFSKLVAKERSPRSAAYMAYCLNLQGKPGAAIAMYENALEWGGDVPEVHNNLAFSYEISRSHHSEREQLALAEASLRRALREIPNSPTVRLNYVCHSIRRAEITQTAIPNDAVTICKALARDCPMSTYVQRRAARLFSFFPELLDAGHESLMTSIRLGGGPTRSELERMSQWAAYRKSPNFDALINAAAENSDPANNAEEIDRTLEPLSLAHSAAAVQSPR